MTSRNPTPRPRKVAGRSSEATRAQPTGEVEPVETTAAEAPADPSVEEVAQRPSRGLASDVGTEPVREPAEPPARRGTVALLVAVVILTAVALLQVAYLWGPLRDDPQVSSSRPVLISEAAERSAVDTAARAAVAFTARTWDDYDAQVDDAAAMMTSSFAEEFRQTTDDAKADFLAAEAEVTAEVVAQAVMTATDQQVEVLLFLNQFTTRKDEESAFTPFRLKVTLIDADSGWLVSDVDAS